MSTRREFETQYKVGRVMKSYGLSHMHEELPARWKGTDGPATSLRDLADSINVAILERALTEVDEPPLDGEAANAYRLLTDDDVSAGVRTQQRNRLERAGIDVEGVEADFVTHQAVHTYLTDGLGCSKSSEPADPVRTCEERIDRLRSRTVAVVERSLAELQNGGHITGGSHDALVDIQVYCPDCDEQMALSKLLDDGGCGCDE